DMQLGVDLGLLAAQVGRARVALNGLCQGRERRLIASRFGLRARKKGVYGAGVLWRSEQLLKVAQGRVELPDILIVLPQEEGRLHFVALRLACLPRPPQQRARLIAEFVGAAKGT